MYSVTSPEQLVPASHPLRRMKGIVAQALERGNATHESETDPEVRLARKGQGKEAKLSYSGYP